MMTEQMKIQAVSKIRSGDCSFGIGRRNGKRVLSVTVVLPAEKDACKEHGLPMIYLSRGEPVCAECLKEIEWATSYLQSAVGF